VICPYLAALKEESPTSPNEELPQEVEQVLEEFRDVMPPELPKRLPPRREVDHKIELEPGAKPPSMAPYRMAPPELEELRKQLKDLFDAGFIQSSPPRHLMALRFFSRRSMMVH
jgi:hypothetical protein